MADNIRAVMNRAAARCAEFPNTVPAVVEGWNGAGSQGFVLLRPDQDWMVARCKEYKIPYILIADSWPQPTHIPTPERERGRNL